MAHHNRVSLIAAVCKNMGIGKDNKLPWRLKAEMEYFNKITTQTTDANKKNVVVMGKGTWESIPPKFRPLDKRINVVISRSLKSCPVGADHLVPSLDACMSLVNGDPGLAGRVETVFVIGGAVIYKLALESPYLHRLYLTRIDADYDCDTFFPHFDPLAYDKITDDADVPQSVQEERGVRWVYELYQRRPTP